MREKKECKGPRMRSDGGCWRLGSRDCKQLWLHTLALIGTDLPTVRHKPERG